MAVKQGEPRVVGYKIDINSAEAFDQDGVFENSGCFFSIDLCDLEIVAMQVQRMHIVALVDESEAIASTLVNLNRLALLVGLSVYRPNVEPTFASVYFSYLHWDHFVWSDRRSRFAKVSSMVSVALAFRMRNITRSPSLTRIG